MNRKTSIGLIIAFLTLFSSTPLFAQEDVANTEETTYVDEFSAAGDSATTTEAEILNYSADDYTEEESKNNHAIWVVMIAAGSAALIGFVLRKKKSA